MNVTVRSRGADAGRTVGLGWLEDRLADRDERAKGRDRVKHAHLRLSPDGSSGHRHPLERRIATSRLCEGSLSVSYSLKDALGFQRSGRDEPAAETDARRV